MTVLVLNYRTQTAYFTTEPPHDGEGLTLPVRGELSPRRREVFLAERRDLIRRILTTGEGVALLADALRRKTLNALPLVGKVNPSRRRWS